MVTDPNASARPGGVGGDPGRPGPAVEPSPGPPEHDTPRGGPEPELPLGALLDAPEGDTLLGAPDPEAPLDAAASLALVADQQRALRRLVEPDNRLLFAVWGLAWLLGYALLWWSSDRTGASPGGLAFAGFAALLVAAVVVTMVHTISRSRVVSGPSATAGAMYGWAWTISFVAVYLVMSGLERAGLAGEPLHLAWNALPCLIVGLLYLGGGAMWQARGLYVLGVWILLVAGAATVVGLPGTYLVMAGAGGGGFLVMAVVEHARNRR